MTFGLSSICLKLFKIICFRAIIWFNIRNIMRYISEFQKRHFKHIGGPETV